MSTALLDSASPLVMFELARKTVPRIPRPRSAVPSFGYTYLTRMDSSLRAGMVDRRGDEVNEIDPRALIGR
jgi:hypothetical protein